jgi:hypothetical protein
MPSAIDESPSYRSFLDCVRDFYREAGRELPYFDTDSRSPLTFQASIDEVKFSVGYDPAAGQESLFIYCPLGPVPEGGAETALRRLMALNLAAAREHNAVYCVDTTTDEIAYYLRRNPAQAGAAWLREELVRIAKEVEQWRDDPFRGEPPESEAADDEAAPFASWQAFA